MARCWIERERWDQRKPSWCGFSTIRVDDIYDGRGNAIIWYKQHWALIAARTFVLYFLFCCCSRIDFIVYSLTLSVSLNVYMFVFIPIRVFFGFHNSKRTNAPFPVQTKVRAGFITICLEFNLLYNDMYLSQWAFE